MTSSAPTSPTRIFGGRYRTARLLKSERGVETLLGTDLVDGGAVVLKVADSGRFPSSAEWALRQEAAAVADLGRDVLAPMLTLGRDGDLLFQVTPFVSGVTMRERLRVGPFSLPDALTISRRLFTTAGAMHERGVLHHELRPENIVLGARSPVERVTLTGLGIRRSELLEALDGLPAAAGWYTSPERAGLLERELGPPSDLYSLGAVLFEMLAGRPPHSGQNIREVLHQQLATPAPRLRAFRADVPRVLEELVARLLEREPDQRYQSAAAALADLEALADALRRGDTEPGLVIGAHDLRRTLVEPALVPRPREFSLLWEAFAAAREGRGELVLMEAESGAGKSRLLQELARRCAQQGAWVLRGQGLERSALHPFQPFSGIAAELSSARGERASAFAEKLGGDRAALRDTFPELAPLLGPSSGEALGPEFLGEARSLRALTALLDALGTPERPAVVLLDDFQWAEALSVRALARWASQPGPGRYVTVVAAFRSEAVLPSSPLREIGAARRLKLSMLDPSQVGDLVRSMAGPLPEEAIQAVWTASGGSPLFASSALRGLVEADALVPGPRGWVLHRSVLDQVRSPEWASEVLGSRIGLLPPAARRLLATAAVLGKTFDLDAVAALSQRSREEVEAELDSARQRHILWTTATGALAFTHDQLRQAALELLTPDEERRLHLLAAESLEHDPFRLAYHLDAGGEPARALPFALAAAQKARARHALDVAERYYRIAERGAAAAGSAQERQIVEELADVLMFRGRYEDAEKRFGRALELAEDAFDRARIEKKLGELAFKRGDVREASDAGERALRLLGLKIPRTLFGFAVLTLWELLVQVMHVLFPRLTTGRRTLQGAEPERLTIQLFHSLQYPYFFSRGLLPTLWTHLRSLNLAERYPPSSELAQAYASHAVVMASMPAFRRALRFGKKGLEVAIAQRDLWAQGIALQMLGISAYFASRFEESLRWSLEAVEVLERSGDVWAANNALSHTARCRIFLGDLRGAAETCRRLCDKSAREGDLITLAGSLEIWAKANGGRIPAGLLEEAESRVGGGDGLRRQSLAQARALRALADGQPEVAVAVLEKAEAMVRRQGFRNEYVVLLPVLVARALRVQAHQVPSWAPARREALIRRAIAAAERGLKRARRFQNSLPQALRELAVLEAMRGRGRRARRLLDEALSVAEAQGAAFERERTLQVRGELGVVLSWPNAASELEAARRHLLERGGAVELEAVVEPGRRARPTLSLADRFSGVLEQGRKLSSALTQEAVAAAVRSAAVQLLRAEECQVELVPGGDLAELGGDPLLKRAIATGRPAVAEGRTGVRSSAIAAVIFVRGRPAAWFRASHGRVARLFGEEEVRLAEYIATLAGAAMENAEGFATANALAEERATLYTHAQEAVRARDEFLGIASHELKTPLTSLKLQVQALHRALQGGLDGAALRERLGAGLGHLDRNVRRLARLVFELLDVSREGEPSEVTPVLERLDLCRLVRDLADRFAPDAERSGCELQLELPGEVNGAWDRFRLERVVDNLLSNAIKYGAGKPVRVAVEDRGRSVVLTVEDHGIGIPPEDQERIFGKFERAVSVRHYGGLGLGLYITRQAVSALGGEISLDSAPNRGSRFTVRLPKGIREGDGRASSGPTHVEAGYAMSAASRSS